MSKCKETVLRGIVTHAQLSKRANPTTIDFLIVGTCVFNQWRTPSAFILFSDATPPHVFAEEGIRLGKNPAPIERRKS